MIREAVRAGVVASAALLATCGFAAASTPFDGAWSLTFNTRRGNCDPSSQFDVYITNGIIRNPNLVRFKGRVALSGEVRASVAVEDKIRVRFRAIEQKFGSRQLGRLCRWRPLFRHLDGNTFIAAPAFHMIGGGDTPPPQRPCYRHAGSDDLRPFRSWLLPPARRQDRAGDWQLPRSH